MALDKKTIKRKLHGILHYENTMVHSTFNEKNFSKALKSFAEKDPENLSSFRSLGKRKDNKDFYPEIKKIDKAYNTMIRIFLQLMNGSLFVMVTQLDINHFLYAVNIC